MAASPFEVVAELVYDPSTDTLSTMPRYKVSRWEDGFRLGVQLGTFGTSAEAEAAIAQAKDAGRRTTITGSQGRTVYYMIEEIG